MNPEQKEQMSTAEKPFKATYRKLLKAEAESVIGSIHTTLAQAENYNADYRKNIDKLGHASNDKVWGSNLDNIYRQGPHGRATSICGLMSDELDLHGIEYRPDLILEGTQRESYGSSQQAITKIADILTKMAASL